MKILLVGIDLFQTKKPAGRNEADNKSSSFSQFD